MTPRLFAGPRIEALQDAVYAGPVQRYDMQTRSAIPAQWAAYNQHHIRAPSPDPDDYFGVVFDFSEATGSFDYMCAQTLGKGAALPEGFRRLTVPAGNWAKFTTSGHISTMQNAWAEVMGHWLGQPGCVPRPGPSIEYYPPGFNGMTGNGGFEIWMPVV